jgi:hypothetical protein
MAKGNAAAKDAATPKTDDFKTFVPEDQKVTTLDGEEVSVPRISWGKERRILEHINDLLDVIAKSGILTGSKPEGDAMSDLLAFIFKAAPERMTKAVAILLEKEETWVEDNLVSEEIVGLLLPFLQSKRDSLAAVVAKHLAPLVAQMQSQTLN